MTWKRPHKLQPVITDRRPRNWFVFDTEANRETFDDGSENQTLRLGVCRVFRDVDRRNRKTINDFGFVTIDEFWDGVLSSGEPDRPILGLAYNIDYDVRIVDAFKSLKSRGYELTKLYFGGPTTILKWSKPPHSITLLDAMNYFDGRLADWGEVFNVPKLPTPNETASQDVWFEYCRVDVEILYRLWCTWLDFIDKHDLGVFAPTRASQAFTAFRHRFMDQEILIHNSDHATDLERESYFGGRVEAFHIGTVPNPPFWKLDVNSLYPSVMRRCPVPVKMVHRVYKCSVDRLAMSLKTHQACARVMIDTDKPIYPLRLDNGLVWPIGTFWTTLATPELRVALRNNHIKNVRDVAWYEHAVIFRSFVDYFWELRTQYQIINNTMFDMCCKYLMNSLYGKFGQCSEQWVKRQALSLPWDGTYICTSDDNGFRGGAISRMDRHGEIVWRKKRKRLMRFVVIAGEQFDCLGRDESRESFPAIAAHITAAARMRLHNLITVAGVGNVFYTDTDSLIVNRAGFERLTRQIDGMKLGKLKLEYKTNSLILYSPKDYKTEFELKHKGISAKAVEQTPGVFAQPRFQRLRGAIAEGNTGSVRVFKQIKRLSRHYTKGVVAQDGSVSPLSFSIASVAAS